MKRLAILAMSAGLTLMASSALVQPALAAPASVTVVVKGHVRSAAGEPIGGVVFKVVQRTSGRNFVSVRGRTSATGRYEAKLPQGESYQLVVSDPGDRDADTADGKWAASSKKVVSSRRTVRIDSIMQPGARLSGHVYESTGAPVRAGLAVGAYRLGGGTPRSLVNVGRTTTRSSGVYRFSNLPAGPTLLLFESGQKNYDSRFYTAEAGGALTTQTATPVEVTAGKAVTRTNFHFLPQRDPAQDLRADGAVDPIGDAPDFIDITGYTVKNGADALVVTTTIPKFDPAALDQSNAGTGKYFNGVTVFANVSGVTLKHGSNPRPDEFLITVGPGYPGAPIDSVALNQFTEDDLDVYPCPGLRAEVKAGSVQVTVPQSCFGPVIGKNAGAVTVSTTSQGNVGPQGESDTTITSQSIKRD